MIMNTEQINWFAKFICELLNQQDSDKKLNKKFNTIEIILAVKNYDKNNEKLISARHTIKSAHYIRIQRSK